jgi:hypothetical protein
LGDLQQEIIRMSSTEITTTIPTWLTMTFLNINYNYQVRQAQ